MRSVLFCGILFVVASTAQGVSDYQFTVVNSDSTSWTLESVSSPHVFSGAVPALNNPTITLIVGNRYQVTDVPADAHPFQIIGKAASAGSDVILLSIGSTPGSFESDPDVGWTDDLAAANEKAEFTVTEALVAAMRTGGTVPGYRCGIHTSIMRGDLTILGEKIADRIPGHISKGNPTIELEKVADGLVSPLGLVEPDDGSNRLFIHEQTGQVWIVDSTGQRLATPFLDVASRLVSLGTQGPGSYDERGLLGFAFHPDFAHHPKVYTYTSEPVAGVADFTVPIAVAFDHQDVLAEWTVSSANPNVVYSATRKELFRNDHPEFNHDGGTIRFGADGLLYFGIGDGGAGDDQGPGHAASGNAQALDTVLGKILRIDVDGGGVLSANKQYGIPSNNPFDGTNGLREIYAYGLRNPYSFSFDMKTGALYLGDAGQNDIEEVDLITAGGNFGWHVKEGTFFFNPNGAQDGFVTQDPVVFPVPPDLIDPIAEYDHDEGHVVVGGCVYRATAISELEGLYIFGDFGTALDTPSGRLFNLDQANNINELRIGGDNRPLGLWIKGFGQDQAGNVYVCGSGQIGPAGTTGVVQKIVPFAGAPITSPTAAFSVDPASAATGTAPLDVLFKDQSTAGSSPITAWEWTFGDGGSSADQNPKHTYASAGTYTVALTVTTAVGSDSVTKAGLIVVTAPPGTPGCFGGSVSSNSRPSASVLAGDLTLLCAVIVLLVAGSRLRARRPRTIS